MSREVLLSTSGHDYSPNFWFREADDAMKRETDQRTV